MLNVLYMLYQLFNKTCSTNFSFSQLYLICNFLFLSFFVTELFLQNTALLDFWGNWNPFLSCTVSLSWTYFIRKSLVALCCLFKQRSWTAVEIKEPDGQTESNKIKWSWKARRVRGMKTQSQTNLKIICLWQRLSSHLQWMLFFKVVLSDGYLNSKQKRIEVSNVL